MIGKIVKVSIVGLLAATLIGGSAYVVLRPDEARALQETGGRGQSGRESVSETGGGKGYGAEKAVGQDTGRGNGQGNSAIRGNGQGAGRDGDNSERARGSGEGYADTEWLAVSGEVIALVDGELTVETADGELVAHLGPEWYWDAEGIALDTGDAVELSGFFEGDDFEVAGVENTTTGESVILRDESGHPMWAGGGRRGG
jgi:hypothetical protein